jgi:glycosyltransferase involved in cell wall biosynthesis
VGQEAGATVDLSIVIPVYNEEGSLPPLMQELSSVLGATALSYEVLCVDDGSSDRSYEVLRELSRTFPSLVAIRLRRNFGQTAAMQAGFDAARGDVVVPMDADLQYDPADIPAMLERLNQGYDVVAGWRAARRDTFINRRLPSMIANRLISATTGVHLHDYGCTIKVIRRELVKELRLYGELHRFIPAVASLVGARICEVKVNHRPRQLGKSKYGIGRTVRVVLDLMAVLFMGSYMARPIQIFGLAGLASGGAGFLVCSYLALQKLVYGQALADRPLLLLGVLLIVMGVQLVSIGLVAEVVARTYHESQGKPPYHVRSWLRGGVEQAAVPRSIPPSPERLAEPGAVDTREHVPGRGPDSTSRA